MQSIQLIQTMQWIQRELESICGVLLSPGTIQLTREAEKGSPLPEEIILATYELARKQPILVERPMVVDVLTAFSLDFLLVPEWPAKYGTLIRDRESGRGEIYRSMNYWNWFTESITPLSKLLIPEAIRQEHDFDETLTIEWRSSISGSLTLEVVAHVLNEVNSLYLAIARGLRIQNVEPLQIIFADSGSPLRIDLKGLGEPIKHVKDALLESWRRIRHWRADELTENSKAALSGLEVLRQLGALESGGKLTKEDCNQIRGQVVSSIVEIFGNGAVPREIPSVERVENQRLIEERVTKLLPHHPSDQVDEKTDEAIKPRKKKVKKAAAKRATPKDHASGGSSVSTGGEN